MRAPVVPAVAFLMILGSALAWAEPPSPPPTPADDDDVDGDEPDPTPTPTTPPDAGAPPKPHRVKDGMVFAEGGAFLMGSDDKRSPANERPAHHVTVAPFWIDRTEVTVGAYRACVGRGVCPRPSRSSAACTWDAGDPDLPISCVPWAAAEIFCLSVGKRLPREVEWEYAARGPAGGRYPWGTGFGCGLANTLARDNSQRGCAKRPSRVGSHPLGASPVGALDMSGNVEEWTADWYAEAATDRSPRAGSSHVLRGGGWLSWPSAARVTSRNWGSVTEAGPNIGFRCARDDSSAKSAH